jgi:hypothetical protein
MNTNNIYVDLLKSTSNTKITFLSDVKTDIKIDKRGKFNYFYIPFSEARGIAEFISKLDNNFYTVIPFLSVNGRNDDPHLILSRQILITRDSSAKVIHDYLNLN